MENSERFDPNWAPDTQEVDPEDTQAVVSEGMQDHLYINNVAERRGPSRRKAAKRAKKNITKDAAGGESSGDESDIVAPTKRKARKQKKSTAQPHNSKERETAAVENIDSGRDENQNSSLSDRAAAKPPSVSSEDEGLDDSSSDPDDDECSSEEPQRGEFGRWTFRSSSNSNRKTSEDEVDNELSASLSDGEANDNEPEDTSTPPVVASTSSHHGNVQTPLNIVMTFDHPFTSTKVKCDESKLRRLCQIFPELQEEFQTFSSPNSDQNIDHDQSAGLFGPPYSVQNVGGNKARFYQLWKKTSVLPEEEEFEPEGMTKLILDAIKKKINYIGSLNEMRSSPQFLEEMERWNSLVEKWGDKDKEKAYRPLDIVSSQKKRRERVKPANQMELEQEAEEEEMRVMEGGDIHHDESGSEDGDEGGVNSLGKIWMKWQDGRIFRNSYNGPASEFKWGRGTGGCTGGSTCLECWRLSKLDKKCLVHCTTYPWQIVLIRDTNNLSPSFSVVKLPLAKEIKKDKDINKFLRSREGRSKKLGVSPYLQDNPTAQFKIENEWLVTGQVESVKKYQTIHLAVSMMVMIHNAISERKIKFLDSEIGFDKADLPEVLTILNQNGFQFIVGQKAGKSNLMKSPILHEEFESILPHTYFSLGGVGEIYSGGTYSPVGTTSTAGSTSHSKSGNKKNRVGTKMNGCQRIPLFQPGFNRKVMGHINHSLQLSDNQNQIREGMKNDSLKLETIATMAVILASMFHEKIGGFPILSANERLNHYDDIGNLDNFSKLYQLFNDDSKTLILPTSSGLFEDGIISFKF